MGTKPNIRLKNESIESVLRTPVKVMAKDIADLFLTGACMPNRYGAKKEEITTAIRLMQRCLELVHRGTAFPKYTVTAAEAYIWNLTEAYTKLYKHK